MEVLQLIRECPCSLFQEVRFGSHIPLGTEFPSGLAGQFESYYLGNTTKELQAACLSVLPLSSVLITITVPNYLASQQPSFSPAGVLKRVK